MECICCIGRMENNENGYSAFLLYCVAAVKAIKFMIILLKYERNNLYIGLIRQINSR